MRAVRARHNRLPDDALRAADYGARVLVDSEAKRPDAMGVSRGAARLDRLGLPRRRYHSK